jgi:hypothetical protein
VVEGLPQPATGKAGDVAMFWTNYQPKGFIQGGRVDYQMNPLEQEAWIGTDMMLKGAGQFGKLPLTSPLQPLVEGRGR